MQLSYNAVGPDFAYKGLFQMADSVIVIDAPSCSLCALAIVSKVPDESRCIDICLLELLLACDNVTYCMNTFARHTATTRRTQLLSAASSSSCSCCVPTPI